MWDVGILKIKKFLANDEDHKKKGFFSDLSPLKLSFVG